MEHTLALDRLPGPGQPAVPYQLSLVRHRTFLYLRLVGEGDDLVFRLNFRDFFLLAATLLHVPQDLAEQPPAAVEPQPQTWVFSGDDDLPDNIEPRRDHEITMADLRPGDDEYNWRLIVRRFPWLFAKDFGYKQAVKYAEQVSAAKAAQPDPLSTEAQLQLDLATVRPHLRKIIQQGQFVYGYQSRIAEALGIPNAGGSRRRIKNVADALAEQYEISTTTTTSTWKKAANE